MPQCIAPDPAASGVLSLSNETPCTTLLALTPAEYSALALSPLNLDAADGMALSVAILSVWGIAYGFRALGRALNTDGEVNE